MEGSFTVFATVVSGVSVYAVIELLSVYVLEPIKCYEQF